MLGEQGDALRARLKRNKSLKIKADAAVGKAYSRDQKEALLNSAVVGASRAENSEPDILGEATKKVTCRARSPYILPSLALAFNAGMRNSEIRNLTWSQIDFEKRILTVGKSKTAAGEGRTIP